MVSRAFGESASASTSVNGGAARYRHVLTENHDTKATEDRARPAVLPNATIRQQIEAAQRAFLDDEVKKTAIEAYKLEQSKKVFAQLKKDLGVEVKESLKVELVGEVIDDLKAELQNMVILGLREELRVTAILELKKELTAEVTEFLKKELKDEIRASNEARILAEVKAEVEADLRHELIGKVSDDLRTEYAPQIIQQLRMEMLKSTDVEIESVESEQEKSGEEADDREEVNENDGGRTLVSTFSSGPKASIVKDEPLFFTKEDDHLRYVLTERDPTPDFDALIKKELPESRLPSMEPSPERALKRSASSSVGPDIDEEGPAQKRRHFDMWNPADAGGRGYGNVYDEVDGEEDYEDEEDDEEDSEEDSEEDDEEDETKEAAGRTLDAPICLDDSEEE